MNKKLLFYLSSMALSLSFGSAQSQNIPFRNYCATDSMTNAALQQYPDYARGRQAFKDMVKTLDTSPNAAYLRQGAVNYTIPIVIHIIHTYGADNISDAQVHDAVRVINEDFAKLNADTSLVSAPYQSRYANVGFQFKLAQKDPNGNCTTGITRTYSTLTNSAGDNVKALVDWSPSKYLNIWVVENIASGAGGYSYLPCGVPQNIEGVVIRNTQFGSIGKSYGGNLSVRSLTHEIGHYMGLPHVWGGSNTPGATSNCGMDDGIGDTPNTIGSATQICSLNANTCPIDKTQPDPDGTLPDNVENYMDYSNCGRMYTNGQKTVMVNALLNQPCRSNLATPANLIATGTNPGYTASCAPISDFSSNSNRVCEGTAVSFTAQSYNTVAGSNVTYAWTFPGGVPATSTLANPVVTYNTFGVYDVTLTTSNNIGNHTITKTGTVTVNKSVSSVGAPFTYGFETNTFPIDPANADMNWNIIKPGSVGWEQTSIAAATGNSCARVRNPNLAKGTINAMITPGINLTNITGATMTFKVASAQKTTATAERLAVYISKDCGQTWLLRFNKAGAALATNNGVLVNGSFAPTSNEWRQESINLTPGIIGQNTMFKFEVTSDQGNSLFLDDIEINGQISGVAENQALQTSFNVYPNPSNGQATVTFALPTHTDYSLEVYTITGQQIGSAFAKQKQSGKQEVKLSDIIGGNQLKAGVYLVKLHANGFTTLKKAIVF